MAPKKFTIIWEDWQLQAATVTASSAAANFPVKNLRDKVRSRPWRSVSLVNESVTVDFGVPTYCTCLALLNHNFTFTGQVTVQASDDPAFGTLLKNTPYDAWGDIIGAGEGGAGMHGAGGVILESERKYYAPNPIRVIYFDPIGDDHVRAQYWRLLFTDLNIPEGYFEIGLMYLGLYDDYGRQFGYGSDFGGQDDSIITRALGGQPWTDSREVMDTMTFLWKSFPIEDKYWRFRFFVHKVGISRDFIIDPVPAGMPSERYFMLKYGRFSAIPKMPAVSAKFSELTFEFIETL